MAISKAMSQSPHTTLTCLVARMMAPHLGQTYLMLRFLLVLRTTPFTVIVVSSPSSSSSSPFMDGLLTALIIFMALDYITGLMCAIIDKKLSSAVGFKGICKKVLILLLVGVANIVDVHVVGTGSALRGAVVCFYLSNEGLSLLENAAYIGLPVPDRLRTVLAQLHNRDDKSDTTENREDK